MVDPVTYFSSPTRAQNRKGYLKHLGFEPWVPTDTSPAVFHALTKHEPALWIIIDPELFPQAAHPPPYEHQSVLGSATPSIDTQTDGRTDEQTGSQRDIQSGR